MKNFNINANTVIGDTCGMLSSHGYGRHPSRTIHRWEIIYVLQGTLSLFVDDERFFIQSGQALTIKSKQLHGSTSDYPKDLKFYYLHFYADETDGDGIKVSQLCTPARPGRFVEMLENYLYDIYAGRKNQKVRDLAVKMMLYELADFSDKEDSVFNPLASKIRTYIHEHMSEDLRSSVIAEALGYSSDYIARIYKQTYGETITEAIHKSRVFFGGELLRRTTMSISEIAAAAGFKSTEDFYRVFKRIKNESPSEYRRRHTHDKILSI